MNGITIYTGDCREVLKTLPDNSVHCCVTSPPYWGLRDYGCEGQIGLEQTPDAFVAEMVAVFREVRRVLREDGTCWLNLGDSYCSPNGRTGGGTYARGPNSQLAHMHEAQEKGIVRGFGQLKPKDLVGIPWRVAFALQQPYVNWKIKSEAMRAWVAGIVDGEGCITITKTKSSHCESVSFPPMVQVRMCDREALDKLALVAGSKVSYPQMPPSHLAAKQRTSWQWRVTADQSAQVIAEIYPHLTVKKKQAIVAWNHQLFRAKRGDQARTSSDLEKEEFHKRLINSLNQRESVDLPGWMKEPAVIAEPGWYLRQELIWHKPAPMPESVTDRCTKAHEHIFLLTKSERYYFDADAIKEAMAEKPHAPGNKKSGDGHLRNDLDTDRMGAVWGADGMRNKRSVWTVAAQPYKAAHFATYPPDLIRPCILAGTSEQGVCAACGAPHKRVTAREQLKRERPNEYTKRTGEEGTGNSCANDVAGVSVKTLGWQPTCECDAGLARPVVLDPFFGSGTTGQVARECGCECIGIDLNPEYVKLAKKRNAQQMILS